MVSKSYHLFNFILLVALPLSILSSCRLEAKEPEKSVEKRPAFQHQKSKNTDSLDFVKRTKTKATEALAFCESNKLNLDFCILVDMQLHSGKNRFFVYDFKLDSITYKGLCSHGCCDNAWGQDYSKTNPRFNNIPDSHCSSLGKYKLGKRGYSNWGIHVNYKMHGLDSTNSKAYERFIVLHSWKDVADSETFPVGTPEGWGCPAISNKLLKTIDPLLQKSKKDVLFWIYK